MVAIKNAREALASKKLKSDKRVPQTMEHRFFAVLVFLARAGGGSVGERLGIGSLRGQAARAASRTGAGKLLVLTSSAYCTYRSLRFCRATTPAVTPPAVVAQPSVYTNAPTSGSIVCAGECKSESAPAAASERVGGGLRSLREVKPRTCGCQRGNLDEKCVSSSARRAQSIER